MKIRLNRPFSFISWCLVFLNESRYRLTFCCHRSISLQHRSSSILTRYRNQMVEPNKGFHRYNIYLIISIFKSTVFNGDAVSRKVFERLLQKAFIYVLYTTFWNFINSIMRRDCNNYIGKIWIQFENMYRNCKIFITNLYSIKN